MAFRGALVTKTADQAIPNSTLVAPTWDGGAVYDTDGMFDSGSPTRLTIPSGATHARLVVSHSWATNISGFFTTLFARNGETGIDEPGLNRRTQDAGTNNGFYILQTTSAVVPVTAGDFFEAFAFQTSGGSLDLQGSDRSWFGIELFF